MPIFIKNNKKILYIHIPKTGGSSIEQIFKDNGWAFSLINPTAHPEFKVPPQHLTIEELTIIEDITSFDYIFATVRNPLDRINSEYRYRGIKEPFDEWFINEANNYLQNPKILQNHFRSQVDYINEKCEIFKLENGIPYIISTIADKINEKFIDYENVVNNKSPVKEVIISEKVEQEVMDFYAQDYKQLGYG